MKTCYECGEPWEGSPGAQPASNETCLKCDADLHVCLNCRFYDPSCYNECTSSTVEHVTDKGRHNSCDEFQFKDSRPGDKPPRPAGGKDDMEAKWKQLFG